MYVKGGLGNQLFQLSKALEISDKFSNVEILNDARNHESIRQFHLYDLIAYMKLDKIYISPLKISDSIRVSLAHRTRFLPRYLNNFIRPFFGVVFEADNENFVTKKNLFKSVIFNGYWQTENNTHRLESVLLRYITQIQPSISYLKIQKNTSSKNIVIHIRGQDYISSPENFKKIGVLDFNYYKLALTKYKSTLIKKYIIIITDDEEFARFMFPNVPHSKIIGPATLDPIQSLKIMSQSRNLIICNSTLGWWAAALASKANSTIMMPETWRRDELNFSPKKIQKSHVIPSTWFQIFPIF